MKKVYERPVMMIEGFMANEYVAACYQIACEGYDGIKLDGTNDHNTNHAHEFIGPRTNNRSELDSLIYTKTLTAWIFGTRSVEVPACKIGNDEHWQVTVKEVSNRYPGHPNASV